MSLVATPAYVLRRNAIIAQAAAARPSIPQIETLRALKERMEAGDARYVCGTRTISACWRKGWLDSEHQKGRGEILRLSELGEAVLAEHGDRPYRPTAAERKALDALRDGSLGYWQWRAMVAHGRAGMVGSGIFRRAWADKFQRLGLIKIEDGIVRLTAKGRALTIMDLS